MRGIPERVLEKAGGEKRGQEGEVDFRFCEFIMTNERSQFNANLIRQ